MVIINWELLGKSLQNWDMNPRVLDNRSKDKRLTLHFFLIYILAFINAFINVRITMVIKLYNVFLLLLLMQSVFLQGRMWYVICN
jgi:hypothetical protein